MRIGHGFFRPLRGCRLDGVLSRGLRPWLLTAAPPGLKMRNFKTGASGSDVRNPRVNCSNA